MLDCNVGLVHTGPLRTWPGHLRETTTFENEHLARYICY